MPEREIHLESENPEVIKRKARVNIVESIWRGVWISFIIVTLAILIYDVYVGRLDREYLIDCTTPSGECFRASQERTGEAVRAIIEASSQEHGELATRQIVILAAYCADKPGNQTVQSIERCVEAELDSRR